MSMPRLTVQHQLTLNRLNFNTSEGVKAAFGGLRRPTSTGDEASIGPIKSDDITMKEKVGCRFLKRGIISGLFGGAFYDNLRVSSLEGLGVFKGSCGVLRNLRHTLRKGLPK